MIWWTDDSAAAAVTYSLFYVTASPYIAYPTPRFYSVTFEPTKTVKKQSKWLQKTLRKMNR